MNSEVRIALVGDRDESVTAHRAIPPALAMAATALGLRVTEHWVNTETITPATDFSAFHGVWCIPATPYRNTEGALLGIRHAREHAQPFLGTCGGFQNMLLEYARNVLGWTDAEHGESAPDARRLVITPLSCALVEESETLQLMPGTLLASAYGSLSTHEEYHCRFGLNPAYRAQLTAPGHLRTSAEFADGELRAVELPGHPFFMGTLFQPERAALRGVAPPLVKAFLRAAASIV